MSERRGNRAPLLMTLTNAHTHLELGWAAELCPGIAGQSFLPWITRLVNARIALGDHSAAAHRRSVEQGIARLLEGGVTHVGDISWSGESVPLLLESGLAGIVYVEVYGSNPADAAPALAHARAIIERWRPHERNGMRVGLTIHAPYTVHPDLWALALDYCRREALPLCIHCAESPEEQEWALHGTGPVLAFSKLIGGFPIPPPHTSPVRYLDELGALDLRPLLVHMVYTDADDLARVRRSGSAVAHCPRSNLRLRCGRMALEAYLDAGIPVYLGTDSLSSSPSIDVRGEAEFASALHHGRVDAAALEALLSTPL